MNIIYDSNNYIMIITYDSCENMMNITSDNCDIRWMRLMIVGKIIKMTYKQVNTVLSKWISKNKTNECCQW